MKKFIASIVFILTVCITHAQNNAQVIINGYEPKIIINKNIYGHFSEHLGRCIYDGFWMTDSSSLNKSDRINMQVVDALKKIQIPNLRWPGGCFADEYHWKDGIGVRTQRPTMINTNWGNVTEDNSFGTHEFLDLCSKLGCEPYITANVGSGTVQEMSNWIEYLNFDGLSPLTNIRKQNGRTTPWNVSFWGVGNESWGCGGNMTPEYYVNEFKRYASFAKNYPNARLKKIACGPNSDNYNWTDVIMKNIPLGMMWGISLHYYTVPKTWREKGSATAFDEKEYFTTMQKALHMEELVSKHSTIMDRYDPDKKVALVVDEWGIWTDVEPGTNPAFLYQQNSLRDALVAATTLNIFNNHSDRVRMANLAQTINVLQSLILTKGNKILLTPTYHVFDMFKVHQNAKLLPIQITSPDYAIDNQKIPSINVSASQDSTGAIHISFVNLNANQNISVQTTLNGIAFKNISAQILTADKFTDINTFDKPDLVKPTSFNGAKKNGNELTVDLPKLSVVVIELK